MTKYTLTNQGYMGLGIYLGYKASYRRPEMERHGVNYDEVVAELTKLNIIKSGKINKDLGYTVFRERFPGQLASQTHQYRSVLGFEPNSYS
jgi:hypothetical protein